MPESESLPLKNVMDLLIDAVCIVDNDGNFQYLSAACEQILGYKPSELIGRNMMELVHPDDHKITLRTAQAITNGESQNHFENRYIKKDGNVVHIMWSARHVPAKNMRIAVAKDVTELKYTQHLQQTLYRISDAVLSTDSLATLYQRIHHIIAELVPTSHFVVVNFDPEKTMVSYPYFAGEASESEPHKLESRSSIGQVIKTGAVFLTDTTGPAKQTQTGNWLGVPLLSEQQVVGAIVVQNKADPHCFSQKHKELLQFVSSQIVSAIKHKQAEENLRFMANHDPLTGLANRALFYDRLEMGLKRAERYQQSLLLIYLDLNNFKQVNDSLGHDVGDLLLQQIAARLNQAVRETDTVCRMGGDEFTLLFTDIHQQDDTASLVLKIKQAVEVPLELADHKLQIQASIGAACYPNDGSTSKQLIKAADMAMYGDKK